MREVQSRYGYQHVWTGHLVREDLYGFCCPVAASIVNQNGFEMMSRKVLVEQRSQRSDRLMSTVVARQQRNDVAHWISLRDEEG